MADLQGTSNSSTKINVLSSDWMGLSDYLVARFYPVNYQGLRDGEEQIEVHAALTDANLEATLNWQSPFESSSPDTKAPALMAMLQSGSILPNIGDFRAFFFGGEAKPASLGDLSAIEQGIKEFEGRTGITKLNSTQIFTGMPPIKITVTALFRAYKDPYKEVEKPFQKLMSWALPKQLSGDSLTKRVTSVKGGIAGYVSTLLPSRAPQLIGFQYKRRTYGPMVIESIGEPMSSPIDKNGYYTELAVPMTLATLTALDKDDMMKIMNAGAVSSGRTK